MICVVPFHKETEDGKPKNVSVRESCMLTKIIAGKQETSEFMISSQVCPHLGQISYNMLSVREIQPIHDSRTAPLRVSLVDVDSGIEHKAGELTGRARSAHVWSLGYPCYLTPFSYSGGIHESGTGPITVFK